MSERDASAVQTDKPSEIEILLPEGQKLTIRSLEPGSVVEVASWRGTGKPDDSAIRMLFGAGGNDGAVSEANGSSSVDVGRSGEPIVTRHHKKLERIMHERRSARRVFRRAMAIAVSVLIFVGTLVALHASGIAQFHRPDSGLTTGLGPASSAIAVVNNSVDIVSSSTVLVMRGNEVILAGVAEVGDNELTVFDESGPFTISREDVLGRLLFVLPFLGYLGG